jgi:glucose-6-phosphate 1-dehydrogenase
MIEKPISRSVNNLVHEYFDEDQIFRVDHYLGKENLRKVFEENINDREIKKVIGVIHEDFGVGRRGVYYDSIGALVDMGQNHLLQMVASVFTKDSKPEEREKILKSLVINSKEIFHGQYEGYLDEENVSKDSNTDTFFALKTSYKKIPIIISSGKFLHKNEAKIIVGFNDGSVKEFLISPTEEDDNCDPYERLILDAVNGDITFFNTQKEIEYSWNFIEKYQDKNKKPEIYKKGSNFFDTVSTKFSA